MAKVKAVIFDLDNTLVDFMKMKDAAIDAAADAMIDAGLPLKKFEAIQKIKEIYQEKGIEYQQVFDQFLLNVLGEVNPKILAAGIIAYRRARESTLVAYPKVTITLLELLKRGLKLAVVSDAPRLQAWLRLCGLNIHNYFDVVVTLEDTNKRKPDPEPFKKTLQLLNLQPNEVIMVGDWPERDIVGAKLLGMRTVFARYGDTFGTKFSGADWEIDEIYDLIKIIDEENKK
ncbi:MAG: TIGR02253 family HAD-type hydrolase [candidate division WOR-3 bacterium]|nr:TIGR02253 family HAD-type hydrolase [candidate division WOR-3 bacterium]MCX7757006.1 TIGR02253 family HAD-type hydrolase [candidate division WOR-3 bacterium]MDW7988337.1 TIGR02253 family HAD-type hydrolase [candidate division WOR-3 bacterium]